MKSIKAKLRSKNAETISEALVAILIISLIFIFLAGAIVTAAKVNETFRQRDITLRIDSAPEDKGEMTIDITYTTDYTLHTVEISANRYHLESGNREEGYDYYEYEYVPAP